MTASARTYTTLRDSIQQPIGDIPPAEAKANYDAALEKPRTAA